MDGFSLNTKQNNLETLRELFPHIFSEGKLDLEKFKAAFHDDIDFANERYTLNWAGKSDAFKILQEGTTATLKPQPELSVNFDTTENVFIEGENLEVLKILQKSYYGKIKCIIIDPPYNTGSDSFIYPDRFKENLEAYEKRVGERDEEGYLMKEGLFRKNSRENGHYHSNWLNMMLPRLFLARNLLRDDGVIFVHIDDNEVHNLRLLMNEIFGEENFVAQLVRASSPTQNIANFISVMHDYTFVYCKNKELNGGNWLVKKNNADEYQKRAKDLIKRDLSKQDIKKELKELVKYPRFFDFDHYYECDEKGVYQTVSMGGVDKGNTKTEILHPLTKKKVKLPQGGWRYKENELLRLVANNEIDFGENEEVIPRKKLYLNDYLEQIPKGIGFYDTQADVRFLKDNNLYFDFPKPVEYIKYLMTMINDKSAIVLDFFAGSATTAHAVLDLNKEDGGSRKFILVQLPELCDESSEAYKAGYRSIADISRERIRRVVQNSLTLSPSLKGDGNGMTYSENLFKGASPIIFNRANRLRLKDKTEAEEKLWNVLRNKQINNIKFRRQHPISNFIADFYAHQIKLVIEVDGGYHNKKEQKEYDEARTKAINEFGIEVIRFTNAEVMEELDTVIEKIKHTISQIATPSPVGEGRGEAIVGLNEAGFRSYKLSPSNVKVWRSEEITGENLEQQMEMFIDPVKPESEVENMLIELMLKSGYQLTDKVENRGDFYYINNELVIALTKVDLEIAARMSALQPQKAITLVRLVAGNDEFKTNTALQMCDAGVELRVV
ncbi:hypothetical protein R83H12_01320 [Fibrobacteria bacterium R8-3-H12]